MLHTPMRGRETLARARAQREQRLASFLPVRTGDVLAEKYRIGGVIGAGGNAVILEATHVSLGERVAIKMLIPGAAAEDASVAVRFLKEAKAVARLRSEHVARVVDFGTTNEATPYLVMEYLDGADFESLLE